MSKTKQNNIVHEAEKIYLSNDNSKLLKFLKPHISRYKTERSQDSVLFNHLLAFAYAIENKLSDAEKHCNSNITKEKNPIDYYFVLSYVHLTLREYDKVLKYSDLYFATLKLMESAELNYSFTKNYQCQMYNFIGSVHIELGNHKKAKTNFLKSIKLDIKNHLPYLNLLSLYIHNKEIKQAKTLLKKGLKNCSQIQELRLFEKSIIEKPTISACMIVKDEEELLGGCLESIRDWVDEIIVVDTGSSDKTVEIAKSYGAKVFHQKWEGNFSKHRNYSISKATSEWVFIIDADERMVSEDIPTLIQTLNNKNYNIISINVFNVYGDREQTTTFLPSVRFWRNELNLKYEGVVHNLLKLGMEHPVVRANVRLKHLGYDLSKEKMQAKFLRTKTLLEDQLHENPDNAFALYNYAQILKSDRTKGNEYPIQNNSLIIKSALKAVELTNPDVKDERHIHLMCLDQVAWAYFHAQEYEKAYEYAQKAIKLKSNYLDPLVLVGHIFAQQKLWEKAKTSYKYYLVQQNEYSPETEVDPLILSHIDDRASVNYSLGLIAETDHDLLLAKSYYLKSLDADSGFIETNSRLAKLYFKENDIENAKKYYTKQLELSSTTIESLLGLATIYDSQSNYESAEKYYKEAIQHEEFNMSAKFQYAKFLLKIGKTKEADSLFNVVSKRNNDEKTSTLIGDLYFEVSDYTKATLYYKKVKIPTAVLLNNIGNCYFKLEEYKKAETYYSKSLKFETHPDITKRNLGITRIKLGKKQESISDLKCYLQTNSQDYAIIAVLADLYKNENKYDDALHLYESLLQIDSNNISLLFALSECYLSMGHRDSAIVGFNRILSLKPGYEPAQEQLTLLSNPVNLVN